MSKERVNSLAAAIAAAVYAVHRGRPTGVVDEALGNVQYELEAFHDAIMAACGGATIKVLPDGLELRNRDATLAPGASGEAEATKDATEDGHAPWCRDASGLYHCPKCGEAFSSREAADRCCDVDCRPLAYHDLTPAED